MKFLLLICGDESAAAHADDGCSGWSEEMARRGLLPAEEVWRRVACGRRPRPGRSGCGGAS